ncbi:MAG: leucine-rich repeat protein, partial [Solobacterium sp.]|nr:leucine-rich repeat protein [Solobacterium sp.]
MLRKSNRLLSIFMAFFMCFNNLVMPVVAEGEDTPDGTEETVIEVVEEPSEEEDPEVTEEDIEEQEEEDVSGEDTIPEESEKEENNNEGLTEIIEDEHVDESKEEEVDSGIENYDNPNSIDDNLIDDAFMEDDEPGLAASINNSSDLLGSSTGTYNGFTYTLKDDNTITLTYYGGTSTTVTVPSSIYGNPVTEIGQDCFNSSSVRRVTIQNGITTISYNAFGYCEDLTSISIPSSVTTIGDYAFENCISLASITLPSGVKTIGRGAFYYCSNLQTIVIPDSVTKIRENSFDYCTKLITAGSVGSGANVQIAFTDNIRTDYQYAFKYIESISIPNTITIIENSAFSGCQQLRSITLPTSITTIGDYAFASCNSLVSVTIPNTVISLGKSVFSGCSSLETVNLPANLTEISDSMFYSCENLIEINIPGNVQKIGSLAFRSCSRLTDIVLPESVKELGLSAFEDCTSLRNITLSPNISVIGQAFYGCSSLESITIPEGVQQIGREAFLNCSNLKTVYLPSTINYIDSSIFRDCNNIQAIVYNGTKADWDAITQFFSGLSKLLRIEFNDGTINTLDFTSESSDYSGKGYQWINSSKTLLLSNFDDVFSAAQGIILPSGSKLILDGENTIKSTYSGSEPGTIIYFKFISDTYQSIQASSGSVLNIIDEGVNNGIRFPGRVIIYDADSLATINISSNATGFYSYETYGSYNSGRNVTLNINAVRGIESESGIDVTNTAKNAELNITASDYGIICKILDMGDAQYNINVSKRINSDAGIGIKAMDIVEQVGNRSGSLYIEADSKAFEYNGEYNTRINLYNNSYAVVEPWYFSEGEDCIIDLSTGMPAKVLSIQPVGFRVFRGIVVSESGNNVIVIQADAPEDGYEFDRWVKANGNGTQSNGDISSMFTNAGSSIYDIDAQLIPNGKTYITAIYKPISYPITYDLNDISDTSDPIHTDPKTTYTTRESFELVNPVMDGYIFTGWSGTGLIGEDNLSVTIPSGTTGELSFTAHWRPELEEYSVTFNANGGTFFAGTDSATEEDQAIIVTEGNTVSDALVPNMQGKILIGWHKDSDTVLMTTAEVNAYVPTADTVFTAVWGGPVYGWTETEDGYSVTASIEGTTAYNETVSANYAVSTAPSCTETGTGVYTATFINEIYEVQTREVEIPATGHHYVFNGFIWTGNDTDGYTSARAYYICENNEEHISAKSVQVTSDIIPAECETDGKIIYTAAISAEASIDRESHTDTKTVVLAALGHRWGEPEYIWTETENGYSVTAIVICESNPEHQETETVSAVYEVTKEAKCEEPGSGLYTAGFTNELFSTQTREEEIPATGHAYEYSGFTWEGDDENGYTAASVNYVCVNDESHTDSKPAELSIERREATCEQAGEVVYTAVIIAAASTDGEVHTDTKIIIIPALGHRWGEPEYTWTETENGYTVTAIVNCENDPEHQETETVRAVYEVTKEAKCEEPGSGLYTAGFTKELFSTQTREEEIPATGHAYEYSGFTWVGDNENGYTASSVNYVCANDESHTDSKPAELSIERREATCEEAGEVVYTAAISAEVSTDGEAHTDVKTVIIPVLGHLYGEPEWIWSDDYSSATALFTCERDGYQKTLSAEISSVVTAGIDEDLLEYIASVSINGEIYTDVKSSTEKYPVSNDCRIYKAKDGEQDHVQYYIQCGSTHLIAAPIYSSYISINKATFEFRHRADTENAVQYGKLKTWMFSRNDELEVYFLDDQFSPCYLGMGDYKIRMIYNKVVYDLTGDDYFHLDGHYACEVNPELGSYTVTFDLGGGRFPNPSAPTELQIGQGNPIAQSMPAIRDTGRFIGYRINNSQTILNPVAVAMYVPTGDTTITAVWGTTDIALSEQTVELAMYDSVQINASAVPEDTIYPELTWSSADESIAIVTETGMIQALRPGTTTVRVSCNDPGAEIYKDITVTVVYPEIVSMEDLNTTIVAGDELVLPGTVAIQYANGMSSTEVIQWNQYDYNQYVKKEGGVFTITGTVEGTDIEVEMTVTVNPAIAVPEEQVEPIHVYVDEELQNALPDQIKIYWSNGEVSYLPVTWTIPEELTPNDTQEIIGTYTDLYGQEQTIVIQLSVEDPNEWTPEYSGDVTPEDAETVDFNIPNGLWSVNVSKTIEYTGSAITFDLRVYDGKTLLKAGKDYTVKYYNNKKVSPKHKEMSVEERLRFTPSKADGSNKKPYIMISGKGNYSGKTYVPFDITPVDITDEDIVQIDPISAQATGKALKPVPVLYWNGKKLKNKTDYTVDYGAWDRKSAGKYQITVNGKGNYTGTRTVTLNVAEKGTQTAVSKLSVTVKGITYKEDMDFNTDILPTLVVKYGKSTVLSRENGDYTVTDIPVIDSIGTYTFRIVGDGTK